MLFVSTGESQTGQIGFFEEPLHEQFQLRLIVILLQMNISYGDFIFFTVRIRVRIWIFSALPDKACPGQLLSGKVNANFVHLVQNRGIVGSGEKVNIIEERVSIRIFFVLLLIENFKLSWVNVGRFDSHVTQGKLVILGEG
jgi:hypothetical protein